MLKNYETPGTSCPGSMLGTRAAFDRIELSDIGPDAETKTRQFLMQ